MNWPLDGILSFVGLVLGLLCLVAAGTSKPPGPDSADLQNAFFNLSPFPSSKWFLSGVLLIAMVVTYGASQSGNCPTMSVAENLLNKRLAWLLAASAWVAGIAYFYSFFWVRHKFNSHEIVEEKPGCKPLHLLWSELQNKDLSGWTSRPRLWFGARKWAIPTGRRGSSQLIALANLKTLCVEQEPLIPVFSEEAAATLIGRTTLVLLRCLDDQYREEKIVCWVGRFERVGPESLLIRSSQGHELRAPANLGGITPFDEEILDYIPEAKAACASETPEFLFEGYLSTTPKHGQTDPAA